jgi:hypothetical protein
MLERIAESVAAATAQYAADRWPEANDREVRLQFVYDLVLSSLTAFCDMEPLYRPERPIPSVN